MLSVGCSPKIISVRTKKKNLLQKLGKILGKIFRIDAYFKNLTLQFCSNSKERKTFDPKLWLDKSTFSQ